MTPDGCLDAMEALMNTVPNVGRVHRYRRMLRDEQRIKAILCSGADPLNKIKGWMISPARANTTITERNPGHYGIGVKGGGNVFTAFQWQIEGWMATDDANNSEQAFFELAWAIADEFNAYGLLNIAGVTEQGPCDVEEFGYSMLAGMHLCHYARLGVLFRGRTRPV